MTDTQEEITASEETASVNWAVSGALTVRFIEAHFAEITSEVSAATDSKSDLNVDLTEASDIDTSGYQLLLTLLQHVNSKKMKLTFLNAQEDFIASIKLLGDETLLPLLSAEK